MISMAFLIGSMLVLGLYKEDYWLILKLCPLDYTFLR